MGVGSRTAGSNGIGEHMVSGVGNSKKSSRDAQPPYRTSAEAAGTKVNIQMEIKNTSTLNRLERAVSRKLELLRGSLLRWRGAKVGDNFGVGVGTRFLYPAYFQAGHHVSIGDFSYLDCISGRGVKIGNHTSIDRNLWLSCGGANGNGSGFFEIGDHSYIGCNAVLGAGGGGIRIGKNVLIGQSVNMHSESHNFGDGTTPIREQGISFKGITIEDDVWIGSKATILDGVVIGVGAIVGAGAVVTSSIPQYSIAVGVPAKVVGTRDKTNENSRLP
jgi:acetyltransferase-like isoleucine patch superfamily enzyme